MPTESSIFKLSEIISCHDIELSAWCQNGRTQLLALYLSRGEFLLLLVTEVKPVIKRIPWFRDTSHKPAALAFSPSGSFLLVLSEACHLYTVPALPLLVPEFKTDVSLDASDITMFPYPYASRGRTPVSSRRSSLASSSSETSMETVCKFKDIYGKPLDKIGTAVAWWQSLQEYQHVAIVGTHTGDIFMVDLMTRSKIRETAVNREISSFSVCIDNSLDFIFLLVNCNNGKQYKLVLEQKPHGWKNRGAPGAEETEDEQPKNYRARLHGLKQLSVETIANIKSKFAESRAKAQLKPPDELGVKPYTFSVPEPLNPNLKDTLVSVQYSRGRHVLTGYHPPSQLLTVHLMALDTQPLFVHKLPIDTGETLFCDRIIYIVSEDRRKILVVSSHLSESRIEGDSEFNPESILGTFIVGTDVGKNDETIKAIFKGFSYSPPIDLPEKYKIDSLKKLLEEGNGTESCILVTSKCVYALSLSRHIVSSMLHLILNERAFSRAERLCKIFELDLAKVLEVTGDIKLANANVQEAVALYNLATCGPLKITAKLSKLGHCAEVLNYSQRLLVSQPAHLTLTDQINISNLLLLSFVHQILKGGGGGLKNKFLSFLADNDYYDKVLALNIAAPSFLFFSVHKLITLRGLAVDGFNVLVKVVNNLNRGDGKLPVTEMEDLWLCLSEPSMQEALAFRKDIFPVFAQFISRHLSDMPLNALEQLCSLLDPLSPCLRPFVRLLSSQEDENCSEFPLSQLVQLFLVVLLTKLNRDKIKGGYDKKLMLPDEEVAVEVICDDTKDCDGFDSGDEHIWAIRKDYKGNDRAIQTRSKILSCGFGHTALIRDGTVVTWGLSAKGNLGNGPGLARHALPEPLRWFESFKLQVLQVSCGRSHTVALTNNGVYTWGSSLYGQLGLGDVMESSYPRLVVPLVQEKVVVIACGQYHTLVLTSCGSVYGCGWNVHGQLGLRTTENQRVPTLITTLKEHVIVDIAAGHGHSLVLADTGHMYSFGSGVFGQLGVGTTSKSSSPVLVKGITGKVVLITTSYFHNLALTAGNTLYTWGLSPQTVRLQAIAHKRARCIQNLPVDCDSDTGDETPSTEPHLLPTLVDTRNVSGKIMQIACGCHHSALVTENGSLYMWGRSTDGQLGNGSKTEVVLPSILNDGSLKVAAISLGCEFTVAVEKLTGKVFAWGSNGLGQIGVPIKDLPGKGADGKLLVVKSHKRVVKLPSTLANSVLMPEEVPGIPSATFTYQSLSPTTSGPVSLPPKAYNAAAWHQTLQHFFSIVHPDMLLCKCLEMGNHQAASKLLFLQGQIRQSLVHQLKALQQTQKNKDKEKTASMISEERAKKVKTPDSEIQLFAVQGGVEEMCDTDGKGLVNETEKQEKLTVQESPDVVMLEYTNTACEILLRYLLHATDCASDILETGIQFWSAQKLPFSVLEGFFREHMDRVFYPLGSLMYLNKRDLARYFSTEFQLDVTARLVGYAETNGACGDYLSVLSRLLSLDAKTSVEDITAKLQNPPQKGIQLVWPAANGSDSVYIFSCGHTTSRITLPPGHRKLEEAYAKLDTDGAVAMACPECVCSVLSAEVA